MAYVTPYTFVDGDPLLAAQLNAIQTNIVALKAPPTATHNANEASDWSTSSTSFTAIDATDLSLQITTTGGDILVTFCGNVATAAAGNNAYFQIVIDSVGEQGDDGYIAYYLDRPAPGRGFSFAYLIEGVAAGTHTIVINWKVSSGTVTLYGGAGTSGADLHPQMMVREV